MKNLINNETVVNRDNSMSENWDNSSSVNYDNSRSVNRNNSSSVNRNNSSSVNYDNSSSVSRGNSSSVNRNNSSSVNRNKSSSINYDNSSSENRDDSSSVNRNNSSSDNWSNSSSKNYDNSRSVNRGSSKSVNFDNSSSKNYGNSSSVNRNKSSSKNYDNSRSENRGNSSSVNRDDSISVNRNNSSSVNLDNSISNCYDSSKTKGFMASVVRVYSSLVEVDAYDNCTVYCHVEPKRLTVHGENVNVIRREEIATPSFDDWLSRGYVFADGICLKLVSSKTQGHVTVYECKDFSNKISYVARSGDKFSHGETIEKSISDLRYKISSRDTSRFSSWEIDDIKPIEELIEAYRVVTGACEAGVKMFLENKNLSSDKMSVQEAIALTENQHGHESFKNFFTGEK